MTTWRPCAPSGPQEKPRTRAAMSTLPVCRLSRNPCSVPRRRSLSVVVRQRLSGVRWKHGHGWYGFGMDVEQAAREIEALREMEQRYRRPADLGRLELSVTPPGYDIDPATVARYAAIGVDRLILRPQPTLTEAEVEPFIATTAQALKIREIVLRTPAMVLREATHDDLACV